MRVCSIVRKISICSSGMPASTVSPPSGGCCASARSLLSGIVRLISAVSCCGLEAEAVPPAQLAHYYCELAEEARRKARLA